MRFRGLVQSGRTVYNNLSISELATRIIVEPQERIMDDLGRIIEVLGKSTLFREYAAAFHEALGVSLCLEAATQPFNSKKSGCSRAPEPTSVGPQTVSLSKGIYCAVIPIFDGARLIGRIRTGPILEDLAGGETSHRLLARPVLSRRAFLPLLKLLSIFAEQLGSRAGQLVLRQEQCEPGIVRRAKQYIHANHRERLELAEVSRHAHVSTYHLCKVFKQSTGINFSNYIARIRVEAARELLNKPGVRIGEVALEAGFQSLTHFNRVFKRLVGESPRAYRRRLLAQETSGSTATFAKKNPFPANYGEVSREPLHEGIL